MAVTSISNLQYVPDKFAKYIIEESTKKNALVRSGVAVGDPIVAKLINGQPEGGRNINMPFYQALTGEDEVFGETEMTPSNVTTGLENAVLNVRQKAWGDTDLARVFGGTDPLSAIAKMAGEWWVGREQAVVLAILSGLFSGGSSAALKDHILDVSSEEGSACLISTDNTLDAKQLMGDAADKLGVVFMHSATHTFLQKASVIETIPDAESHITFEKYLGYDVIVDDDMPVSSGVYTTYFLGKGAFVREDGTPAGLVPVETVREGLKSRTLLINRRAFVYHPRGLQFKADASLAGKYPSNSELGTYGNWSLVANAKNVPIVALKHRLAIPQG